jgi:hypothetical protein
MNNDAIDKSPAAGREQKRKMIPHSPARSATRPPRKQKRAPKKKKDGRKIGVRKRCLVS